MRGQTLSKRLQFALKHENCDEMQSVPPLTLLCFMLSCLCPTLCNPMDYIACQAPLSMGFFRQEYWNGLPEYWSGLLCPPPEDLPNPGMEPMSLMSPALVRFFTTSATWEALLTLSGTYNSSVQVSGPSGKLWKAVSLIKETKWKQI